MPQQKAIHANDIFGIEDDLHIHAMVMFSCFRSSFLISKCNKHVITGIKCIRENK